MDRQKPLRDRQLMVSEATVDIFSNSLSNRQYEISKNYNMKCSSLSSKTASGLSWSSSRSTFLVSWELQLVLVCGAAEST